MTALAIAPAPGGWRGGGGPFAEVLLAEVSQNETRSGAPGGWRGGGGPFSQPLLAEVSQISTLSTVRRFAEVLLAEVSEGGRACQI